MVALVKMPKLTLDEVAPEDRRLFPRKEVHADVQANRTDHTIEARREPVPNDLRPCRHLLPKKYGAYDNESMNAKKTGSSVNLISG